jgi:hypothetical protein
MAITNISLTPQFGNNTVTQINCGTSSPGLSGTIDLSAFANLQQFRCTNNDITAISGYENNSNLTFMNFSANKVTGSIPSLSGLSNLQDFYCNDNQLTGSIPSLSGLNALVVFYCHNNLLTGSVPTLSGLPNLRDFSCYGNQLTGPVRSLSGVPLLQRFLASNNQLDGRITDLNSNLSLIDCWFHQNNFTGQIPNVPSTNIRDYWFGENFLSGGIPNFNSAPNLERFDCQYQRGLNKITGNIPSLNFNPNLTFFRCGGNVLTGSIPNLNNNTQLNLFHCGNNVLSGSIPSLTQNTDLEEFYCFDNLLGGAIPSLTQLSVLSAFWCYNQGSVINGKFKILQGLSVNNINPADWFDGMPYGWLGTSTLFAVHRPYDGENYVANIGALGTGGASNSFRQNIGRLPTTSNVEVTFTANQRFGASTLNVAIYDGSYNALAFNTYNTVGTFTLVAPLVAANTDIIIGFWPTAGNPSIENVSVVSSVSPKLTGFDGGSVSNTLGDFQAQNNQLTQSSIDAILAAFVAANKTTGTRILNLGGTGNASPTGGQNNPDRLTLVSRGWTVQVN